MYNIWLVEDEKSIAQIVVAYLEREGYQVSWFDDGLKTMQAMQKGLPNLVILDINLPVYSGIDILKELRQHSDIPVIFLTSSIDEASRIYGFELGADDYVTKPFSTVELMHRVRRVLQRVYKTASKLFVTDHMWIDCDVYELYHHDKPVQLTTNEVKLLMTLIKAKPQVLSRQQIIDLTFGNGYEATDRNIDTYIKNIRQKIEDNPKSPTLVNTKYGVGYYFGG